MKTISFLKLSCFCVLFISSFQLSACATIRHENALKVECETSRVLITDLTHYSHVRIVQLPTGEICPRGVI